MSKIKKLEIEKYNPEALEDGIDITIFCEIACQCGFTETDEGYSRNFDFATRFFNKGWRGEGENIYCPKCSKKKLKNINA